MNINKQIYRIGDQPVRVTILTIEPSDTVRLAVDKSFAPVNTVSSIDQIAPRKVLEHGAGYSLGEYLNRSPVGSMACKLGQNMWTAEPLIWKGKIYANKDSKLPDGTYEVLSCSESRKWVCDWLEFQDGEVTPPPGALPSVITLGLLYPLWYLKGSCVDLKSCLNSSYSRRVSIIRATARG